MMSEMEMNKVLEACTVDMRAVADGGAMTLDMQVRAYDLLSSLLEMKEYGIPYGLDNAVVSSFCAVYEASSGKLQNAFAGEIHISLGFQQKDLSAAVNGLAVKTLEFQFINLAV